MNNGWQTKTLDQIAKNLDSSRRPITKSDRVSGEYPYYGASGIVDFVADYIFEEEALLVSEDGANLLARSTPIAFSASGKYWVNNHAHILKFDEKATQRFVELYLNSIPLDDYVTGAAQPKLNQKALNSIPIPLPPLPERQRIIAILNEAIEGIATALTNAEKNAQSARDLFTSHLQSVFTQDGDSLPTGWYKTRLANLALVQSGSGFPTNSQGKVKGGIPFYKVSDMNIEGNERTMIHENNSITEEVRKELGASLFPRGSVIFPKIGGAIATNKKRLTTRDCCVDNNVMGAIPKPSKITSSFLYYFFLSHNLSDFANEAHLPSIKKTVVENWELSVPKAISEQERIVSQLDLFTTDTQHLESIYVRKHAALEALKQSLLHQAFTGQL